MSIPEFKSLLKGKKIHSQSREIISNVNDFMRKEAVLYAEKTTTFTSCKDGFIIPINKCEQRAAAACGVSRTVVQKIKRELRTMTDAGKCSFSTPKKYKRGKPITDLDDFDRCAVRRTIHEYYAIEKELPTAERLRGKLETSMNFKGSVWSLKQILKSLGFQCKRATNNKKIPIEKNDIRQKRINYLKNILNYRMENRPIIYTDATYISSTHTSRKKSSNDTIEKHLQMSKDHRAIFIHAGGEMGFIPNALVMWRTGTLTDNFHEQINSNHYFKWVKEKLIPNLPPESVVVIDNTPYHNIEINKTPTSNSKKDKMIRWLNEQNIPCDKTMLKPELYKLIQINKPIHKTYVFDNLLQNYGHIALRLPNYHSDLNPIETIWTIVKDHILQNNITFQIDDIMKLCEKKFSEINKKDWLPLCENVKKIELEYFEREPIIDETTERFVISLDQDESSSENESEEGFESEPDLTGPSKEMVVCVPDLNIGTITQIS